MNSYTKHRRTEYEKADHSRNRPLRRRNALRSPRTSRKQGSAPGNGHRQSCRCKRPGSHCSCRTAPGSCGPYGTCPRTGSCRSHTAASSAGHRSHTSPAAAPGCDPYAASAAAPGCDPYAAPAAASSSPPDTAAPAETARQRIPGRQKITVRKKESR